jgi:hypothetical protein
MTVMALGKNGHAVHVGALHRCRELSGVEFLANSADRRRRVKVEMNLPHRQGRW